MTALEVMIWSMACGAIGVVALAGLADGFFNRGETGYQSAVWNIAAFGFVFLLSGLAATVVPDISPDTLHTAQVLWGPTISAMGNWGIRAWMLAHQRDRLMADGLKLSAILGPVLGIACLGLPVSQQLPTVAAICFVNASLAVWLAARAWRLGDRLAIGVGAGCALMLPAIAGLHAMAMKLPLGLAVQALVALCSAGCAGLIAAMLLLRSYRGQKERRVGAPPPDLDPVTRLHTGASLVQKLVEAEHRRRRTRREGAVVAVMLFDPEYIVSQAGQAGLNEVFVHIATRMQRQMGVVNPVGRYHDRCFVSLVETIHSPARLRTLGLRVAGSLRLPILVTSTDGRRIEVTADIGVGVVHLREPAEVDDILHEAQRMARAGRETRSRTAIRDPAKGDVVPVENADLGERRSTPWWRLPAS